MLPPLAGGAQTRHYGAEALMQNFNVNLADSASLDYDLSGSGFGP
jgi:ABC-type phosphate/phosphonate transport system ATPase subunit